MTRKITDLTVVSMKNAVFWDITPCHSCKNDSFGGTYCLHRRRAWVASYC
jgi:hypothetical protein